MPILAQPIDARPAHHVETSSPFEAVCAQYLTQFGRRTRQSYSSSLRRWIRWCAQCDIDPMAVTRAHITAWCRVLEEVDGLSPRYVGSLLTPVRGVYAWAEGEGVLDRDPARRVRPPRAPRVSTSGWVTREELAAILAVAATRRPAVDAMVHLYGCCGMRFGETLSARVEHLGQVGEHRTLHLPRRKGGVISDLALPEPVIRAVTRAVDGRTTGWLLRTRYPVTPDGRLQRDMARREFREVLVSAGITRRITPHSLRHSFVTLALDAGVTMRDLMATTGHQDASMIGYYDRARASVERSATYAVVDWLQNAKSPRP